MGEVYRARDPELGRDVAIKVLRPAFTEQTERLARFKREARSLAALNHPHIGAIYGLAEDNGRRGLVLELVEGETLSERLGRGRVPVAEALSIARQVADALEAAHGSGIIHRDLKPGNIKMTADGVVKVLDFGLAKIARSDELGSDLPGAAVNETADGVILGTAPYISPEQARGKAVDKRADIWAFGCVLYELLAGRVAFAGETISDRIAGVLGGEPDWDALPDTTPTAVRRLLHRCLEKDLRRRLRDIGDAGVELEDATVGTTGRRDLTAARVGHSARWWRSFAAIAVALVAIAGTVTVIVPAVRQRRAFDSMEKTAQAVAMRLTDYGGTESATALAPDGRSLAFVSDHSGIPDIWVRQAFGGDAVRLTDDAAEEAELVYASDGETIFFTRVDTDGQAIWRIGTLGGQAQKVITNARMPAPSPDGRSLAYLTAADPAELEVAELTGGAKRTLARGISPGVPGGRAAPAWSPDGRWLAYNQWGLFAPHNMFVIDVSTGERRQVTRFTEANEGIALHAWLPDNRHLAVWRTDRIGSGSLGILDIQDGSILRVAIGIGQEVDALSASRDGSRLLATVFERRFEVWKVPLGSDPDANGRAAVRLVDSTYAPWWTFVSREGRTLLLNGGVGGERNLWTMPLDASAAPRQITAIRGGAVTHSSLSPDGSHVAFASSVTGNSKIWSQNVDGSDLRQLTKDAAADHWPVWSPDGQWIVFGSELGGNVRETRRVPAAGGPVDKIVDGFFRGDLIRPPAGTGTLLVSTIRPARQGSGGLRLLDFEHRTVLWEKHQSGTDLTMPTFSPDGLLISQPLQESRDRHAIWLFETATGRSRLAVRFPGPFLIDFRAGWTDGGTALVVNRRQVISHAVLFDHFWESR
jgi:Tol biopolymer transport system component